MFGAIPFTLTVRGLYMDGSSPSMYTVKCKASMYTHYVKYEGDTQLTRATARTHEYTTARVQLRAHLRSRELTTIREAPQSQTRARKYARTRGQIQPHASASYLVGANTSTYEHTIVRNTRATPHRAHTNTHERTKPPTSTQRNAKEPAKTRDNLRARVSAGEYTSA